MPQGSTNIKEAVYAGDVKTNYNGEFEISFKIPQKTPHINHYTLYVRGANTELKEEALDYILGNGEIIVYDFELSLNDEIFTASAYVKNTTTKEKKPVIFIAQYDENDMLIQVVREEIESNGESRLLTASAKKNQLVKKCRAFIWEGMGEIKPIAPTIEKSAE